MDNAVLRRQVNVIYWAEQVYAGCEKLQLRKALDQQYAYVYTKNCPHWRYKVYNAYNAYNALGKQNAKYVSATQVSEKPIGLPVFLFNS